MKSYNYNQLSANLIFIQNEISPLNVDPDVEFFQNQGIVVEAYSPLGRMVPQIKKSSVINEISTRYKKNSGQIILKWHIQRGVIPIFSSKNPKRIIENLDPDSFRSSEEDIQLINSLNIDFKIFPYSYGCSGY